ncbi:MAG TPA: transporter, partial [Polyangiaceae bacterium]
NTPIARQIDDPVVVAFSITGTSVLAWQGSRRYVLSVGPVVEHTTTISGDNPIVPPSTTAIGGDVTQTYTLTPYSTLSIPIAFREYIVDEREPESPDDEPPEDLDQRTLTAGLAYVHALDLRTTVEASGGVTAVEGGGEPFAVLPQGGIAMNRVVFSTRTQTITNRLAARMIAAFDPTEAQLYPTAGIEASLTGTLGADWRASLAAEAYTTVTEDPVSDDNGDSRAALNAAIGYLLTEEISLDLGVRFSTRASHFSQEFQLTDETLLGFIALSAAFELIPAEQRERTRSTRPSGARSE